MSDQGFGSYDTASGTAHVPDGSYMAEIKSVEVVKRNGEVVRDQRSGKVKIKIVVAVAEGEHAGATLTRTTNVAFGQNSENGKYAAFAEFIEAATGIACGDPEQKKVGEAQLKGRRVVVTVLENSKGYADIVRFKAPKAGAAAPPSDAQKTALAEALSALTDEQRANLRERIKNGQIDAPRLLLLAKSIQPDPLPPTRFRQLIALIEGKAA